MNLEKIYFLLKLIKDDDLPAQLSNSDVVDFEASKGKFTLVVRKVDKDTNEKTYLRYVIVPNNNLIGITKTTEDGYNVFYGLEFGKVLNMNLVNVFVNYKKTIIYNLSDNLLTSENVEILSYRDLTSPELKNERIIGKKK